MAIHLVALVIEAAGSLLLLSYVVVALTALLRQHGLERSRILLADGAILALGFIKRAFAADKAALLRGLSTPVR